MKRSGHGFERPLSTQIGPRRIATLNGPSWPRADLPLFGKLRQKQTWISRPDKRDALERGIAERSSPALIAPEFGAASLRSHLQV